MQLSVNTMALLLAITALAMRMASADTANLAYLLLAGYALLGRVQAVQALALSWLFTMLSEGVAPLASAGAVGRYAVMTGAAMSLLLRNNVGTQGVSVTRAVGATLALGGFLIIHSILYSPLPEISILKAISWTVVVATLQSAWLGLQCEARTRLERQLFVGLVVLVMVSVPLAFTRVGYLRNGTGFQGVLSHPQAFGPVAAVLGAYVAGRLLGIARPQWRDVAFLGLCAFLVVLSETRTAGLALVLGVASAILASPVMTGMPARRVMPGLASPRLHGLAVVAVAGLAVAWPALSDSLRDYVQKRTDSTGLLEAAELSRGALVEAMIENIQDKPLSGIGFGVASDPSSMEVDRDATLGLPTSASIEKGVLPVAVLEELGVCGFLLVGAWVWLVVKRGARAGVAELAVVATLLLSNLGESTLFSPGGMGLLPLILLAWAASGRLPTGATTGTRC